jgi:hypothetical protein
MTANIFEVAVFLFDDPNIQVRIQLCKIFQNSEVSSFQWLAPHMARILEAQLAWLRHSDDELALESCEFWTALIEDKSFSPDLQKILPQFGVGCFVALLFQADIRIVEQVHHDTNGGTARAPRRRLEHSKMCSLCFGCLINGI